MAVYFFDVRDTGIPSPGLIGHDFATSQEAADEAVATLPDIARFELPDGLRRDFTVDVLNERKEVIFTATLSLNAHWTSRPE